VKMVTILFQDPEKSHADMKISLYCCISVTQPWTIELLLYRRVGINSNTQHVVYTTTYTS